ncbi:MAG: S-layer homology domain-containing protein [Oscillospiraceae bacterium]|nr:S-layer homology domain-containing protein [Oscillospiraceae bacterium]
MKKANAKTIAIILILFMTLGFLPMHEPETASASGARVHVSVIDPFAATCTMGGPPAPNQNGIFHAGSFIDIVPGVTTAYSILYMLRPELNIRSSGHPAWGGMYVEAINDWGEFDGGPLSGWMYSVNGIFPGFSSSLFYLQNGDRLEWLYTRNLGYDIGEGMSNLGRDQWGGDLNFNLSHYNVSLDDNNLTVRVTMGGASATQGANFNLDDSALPNGISVSIGGTYGTQIIVEGVRPAAGQPPITGSFEVGVTVGASQRLPLTISANLTPMPGPAPETLELSASSITINDNNLTRTVTIGGTAVAQVSNVSLDTAALPSGVTAARSGNTITVTGVRPAAGQQAITGTFNITVTAGNLSETLAVTVNLTARQANQNQPETLSLSPSAVAINDARPSSTVTIEGATANISLDASELPNGVTATRSGSSIVIIGVRPIAGQPAISGTFNITVTAGNQSEALTVTVSLTPQSATLNLTPSVVEISNTNLTATVTIGGSAAQGANISTGAGLPDGITATRSGNTITIVGVRPEEGGQAIAGMFQFDVTAGGQSETLTINANLTPPDVAEAGLGNEENGNESPSERQAARPNATIFPIINISATAIENWENTFVDVGDGAWFLDSVRFVGALGLMGGTSPGEFSPNTPLSRAMLVTMLARLSGEGTGGGETWFSAAINWGIGAGLTDGTYPSMNITREQFAVMLYRYAVLSGQGTDDATNLSEFSDTSSISPWALDAMRWANASGIMSGRTTTTLEPGGTATRAEAATLLQRFIENLS